MSGDTLNRKDAMSTATASVEEVKPKYAPSRWERVKSGLLKAVTDATGLEMAGWMAVADALATAKDEFDSMLLSMNDDFLPWAALAIRKSEESVKTYLNARACYRSTPKVPTGIGKEALNELWKVKDVAARVAILEETGGDTVKTRKAVKAYRESQLTSEQRTAKAERAANRKAKAVETAVTAVTAELHPIYDRMNENPPDGLNDLVDLVNEVYRLGCERDGIAGEAVGKVSEDWYALQSAKTAAASGLPD